MGRLVTRIIDNRRAPDACRWVDRSPLDAGIWIVTGREVGAGFQVFSAISIWSSGDVPPIAAVVGAPIGDLSPAHIVGLDPELPIWVLFLDPSMAVTGRVVLIGEWGRDLGQIPVFVCEAHATEAPDAV